MIFQKPVRSIGALICSVVLSQAVLAQSASEPKARRADIQAVKQTQAAFTNEIQSLKDSQSAIQKDLQEIKTLLQELRQAPTAAVGPARPTELTMDANIPSAKGDAKFTLVEFTDYQCPFCSRYYRDTYPEIMKEYVNTGKLNYVVREFPLESIHPQAFKAAEAAQCAGEQRKYFEMHDRLFSEQKALGANDLPKHAEFVGLDGPKFQECLSSGKYAKAVRKDLADGQKAGVTGTPSFFLGIAQPNGTLKVVNVLKGAQPFAAFKDAIEGLLSSPL